MSEERRIVTWKQIKEMGWPLSRYHTVGRLVPEGRFPKPEKLSEARGSRIWWWWEDVKPFLEKTKG